MKDYTVIALAYQDQIRIYASTSRHLVDLSRKYHQTKPTATAAMGRFLTASAMISLMYKDGERLAFKIQGDGPIEEMRVEAKQGVVKSTIKNPDVYMVYEDGPKKGKLNVGKAVGRGYLHMTKDYKGHYFTSSSPLQTGEIGDDFTYYFATSEQTPAAVGLGVLVSNGTKVIAAGGFIVQVLPHTSNEVITQVEKQISLIPSITDLLKTGQTPEDIIHLISNGTEKILETKEIKYRCGCSKARYRKSLGALNVESLEEMLHEDKQAEIICQYCGKKYILDAIELQELIDKKKKIKG